MLPSRARLTRPSKWHVTLVFLGEAPPDEVASVLSLLPADGGFTLHLAGGGRFGPAAWAGVEGDLTALGRLRERVRSALADAGFPSDERPYQPHLTVTYRGDRSVRTALVGFASPPWTVSSFALVESKDGDYLPLRAWPV